MLGKIGHKSRPRRDKTEGGNIERIKIRIRMKREIRHLDYAESPAFTAGRQDEDMALGT